MQSSPPRRCSLPHLTMKGLFRPRTCGWWMRPPPHPLRSGNLLPFLSLLHLELIHVPMMSSPLARLLQRWLYHLRQRRLPLTGEVTKSTRVHRRCSLRWWNAIDALCRRVYSAPALDTLWWGTFSLLAQLWSRSRVRKTSLVDRIWWPRRKLNARSATRPTLCCGRVRSCPFVCFMRRSSGSRHMPAPLALLSLR